MHTVIWIVVVCGVGWAMFWRGIKKGQSDQSAYERSRAAFRFESAYMAGYTDGGRGHEPNVDRWRRAGL